MPEESTTPDLVEAVRTGFEAVNRHDLEALRHVYAPDVVVDVTGLGITLTGWAAVRSFVEDWIGAYDEVEWVPEEPLDLGNGVVFAVVFQNGRPKGVAGSVQQREGWVWVFVDGLVASAAVYREADIDEARAAAERLAQERADG